jgi:hypothetical protein
MRSRKKNRSTGEGRDFSGISSRTASSTPSASSPKRDTTSSRTRYKRWPRRTIVGLSSTAAIVGLTILLGKQKHVTTEIQAQRKDAIGKSCRDQNKRHDRTLHRLDKAEKNAEKHAKTLQRKMKIRHNTAVSIGLIDALAPHQNCKAVVRRATQ